MIENFQGKTMPYLRLSVLPLLVAVTLILSACTSVNSGVGKWFGLDTDLQLEFKVDADINPDDTNTPSPLFIRMYELKSKKMFKNADFLDLFERDKATLGADMITKQRLRRIKPGEDREEHFVLDKKTRFIGLYGEFLQYKNSGFKLIVPVVQHDVIGTSAVIQISGNTIKVVE